MVNRDLKKLFDASLPAREELDNLLHASLPSRKEVDKILHASRSVTDRSCSCGRFPGGGLCPTLSQCGMDTSLPPSISTERWRSKMPHIPGFYWKYDPDKDLGFGVNPKVVFVDESETASEGESSFRWSGPLRFPHLP